MARKPKIVNCMGCKAYPDHKPKKGTCTLGHPFDTFRNNMSACRSNGQCAHKCHTKDQVTAYVIELGKNPDYIPRHPRKMRGIR